MTYPLLADSLKLDSWSVEDFKVTTKSKQRYAPITALGTPAAFKLSPEPLHCPWGVGKFQDISSGRISLDLIVEDVEVIKLAIQSAAVAIVSNEEHADAVRCLSPCVRRPRVRVRVCVVGIHRRHVNHRRISHRQEVLRAQLGEVPPVALHSSTREAIGVASCCSLTRHVQKSAIRGRLVQGKHWADLLILGAAVVPQHT